MNAPALTVPASHRPWLALIGWIALAHAAGLVGSFAMLNARTFYNELVQPIWAPPGGVIAPVWLVLYTLMGFAAWFVWRERRRPTGGALTLFLVQLGVNAVWSWIFFAWHLGGFAFGWIVALGVLVFATLVAFWRIRPLAGALLLPYVAWLCFAGALNYTLWKANPALLA